MENAFFHCILLIIGIQSVLSLECYTCVNQDSNKDKCIKTVKQCEQHQDICQSNITWGIPPYWTPHGERIYMISKDCGESAKCRDLKYEKRHRCKRDWYLDWECYECCSGDMCNYYVTLGASGMQINYIMLGLCSLVTLLWGWNRQMD